MLESLTVNSDLESNPIHLKDISVYSSPPPYNKIFCCTITIDHLSRTVQNILK